MSCYVDGRVAGKVVVGVPHYRGVAGLLADAQAALTIVEQHSFIGVINAVNGALNGQRALLFALRKVAQFVKIARAGKAFQTTLVGIGKG